MQALQVYKRRQTCLSKGERNGFFSMASLKVKKMTEMIQFKIIVDFAAYVFFVRIF